jgi:hypothetical protein
MKGNETVEEAIIPLRNIGYPYRKLRTLNISNDKISQVVKLHQENENSNFIKKRKTKKIFRICFSSLKTVSIKLDLIKSWIQEIVPEENSVPQEEKIETYFFPIPQIKTNKDRKVFIVVADLHSAYQP